MAGLIDAIYAGRRDDALFLIRSGGPVDEANEHGTTPLYAAFVQGEAEIVTCLLDQGADPNGASLGTAPCAAAAFGLVEIVRDLLDHGADANLPKRQAEVPMTVLAWARRNNHAEAAALFLERGADTPAPTD
jgi:uncharacterized protein